MRVSVWASSCLILVSRHPHACGSALRGAAARRSTPNSVVPARPQAKKKTGRVEPNDGLGSTALEQRYWPKRPPTRLLLGVLFVSLYVCTSDADFFFLGKKNEDGCESLSCSHSQERSVRDYRSAEPGYYLQMKDDFGNTHSSLAPVFASCSQKVRLTFVICVSTASTGISEIL